MLKAKKQYQIDKIDKQILKRGLIDKVQNCDAEFHHHSHDDDHQEYQKQLRTGAKPGLFKRQRAKNLDGGSVYSSVVK